MSEIVESLIQVARMMDKHQLVSGNAGNISARDGQQLWISGSGTVLSDITAAEFVSCSLIGTADSGRLRPSKELGMHQAVYQEREDVQCVLHASPFFSTLWAATGLPLESKLFIESMYYLYDVEEVPYCHPGSKELATAVRQKAGRTNVIILRNHGVLVYDVSPREALARMATLEMACKMQVYARSSGLPLEPIAPETADDFVRNTGYKSTLPRGLMT